MQIHDLSKTSSVLNNFLSELRDKEVQKDSMRFRRNIERVGEILAYEMSKSMATETVETETPLGKKHIELIRDNPVICSILRAGLPLHHGLLNYFDKAENAFISAFRKHNVQNPEEFEIVVEYVACPKLDDKVLILADPMLASGRSIHLTYEALLSNGAPREIHLVSVIGSVPGLDYVKNRFPENTHLWIAAVDEHLDKNSYIVPGLGDAGDLAFGEKLQH